MTLNEDTVTDHARVGLTVSQGVLIVPVQVELYDDVLDALKSDVLDTLQQQGLQHLLLDLSQVEVMDRSMAQQFAELMKMAGLLGARCIVVGLQPGVVVSMVEWGEFWPGVETVLSLDIGMQLFADAT